MKNFRFLALLAALTLAPLTAHAQSADPVGDWRGVLTAMPGVDFGIALHLGPVSTVDSPDQDAFGLPAVMQVDGQRVTVTVTGIGVYEGVLSEDGAMLVGEWRQDGAAYALDFERGRLETGSP